MEGTYIAQFDIQQAVKARIAELSRELAEIETTGAIQFPITAKDLFYLEALGYVLDFSTGLLFQEVPRLASS